MNLIELEERLKGHAQTTKSIISTPFNLKTESNKLEENNMNKSKNITWLKKVSIIVAVLTICAITVVSADSLKGYFKDVKSLNGATIGTKYLNATNDIKIDVSEATDKHITLGINFANPGEAPFNSIFIQKLAITEYKILDKNNKEILDVNSALENCLATTIENDEFFIQLPMSDTSLNIDETYTLKINTMYGLAKADPPLKITGEWECEFRFF